MSISYLLYLSPAHTFQGSTVGPPTCQGLKSTYGASNVACQGVGSPYDATLGANVLPEGTTSAAYGEAQRLFNLASTKCPNTKIVAGGTLKARLSW